MGLNTARRITVNFLSLFTGEATSRVLQLLISIFLARSLGKEDFGIFSFSFAFGFLFMIIADFGLGTLLVREISRDKKSASRCLFNGAAIKALLAMLSFALASLFLSIMGYSSKTKAVAYLMLLFAAMQSFTELHYTIFRAFERMHYEMGIKLLRMILLAGSVFYLTKNGYGVIIISAFFPLIELLMLAIAILAVYKAFAKPSWKFDLNLSKNLIKGSSVFFLSAVFTTLYLYINIVMLSKMRSASEVGLYSAAANITIGLIFIPLMYCNSIYPVISRMFISSKKSLLFAYEKSFKYMLILAIAVGAGIFSLSERIILFLYGSPYRESSAVLGILAGYIFLKFLNPVTGYTLMAINKERTRLFSQATAALINIILNFVLIPYYGIIGAALATLITEIIFSAIYFTVIIKNGFGFNFLGQFLYKPLISAIIMVFFVGFIENLFLAVIVGAFAYILALLVLKVMDKDDKRIFSMIAKNI